MPVLVIDGEKIPFELALFDLDGTLVDAEDRYRNLASLRYNRLKVRAGNEAA